MVFMKKQSVIKPSYTNKQMTDNYSLFKNFINKNHPCIMAQSVLKTDNLFVHDYYTMDCTHSQKLLLEDLKIYIDAYDFTSNEFRSFVAVFDYEERMKEVLFEKRLWSLLYSLHKLDREPWDKTVSCHPESADFSFSLCGKAFYIVGLHPESSRKARRSSKTAIVFNLHWQFEKLRDMGVYQNVKEKIRENDIKINGSINPVLTDFGDKSEAMQYSGRSVEKNWKCPFTVKEKTCEV